MHQINFNKNLIGCRRFVCINKWANMELFVIMRTGSELVRTYGGSHFVQFGPTSTGFSES
jgi:hypothetical protein